MNFTTKDMFVVLDGLMDMYIIFIYIAVQNS